MVAALSMQGFSLGNQRVFDAWGNVLSGSGPKNAYCANLGHLADAASGLTYMRARYYEPTTGMFISEDPAMDGANWFVYCGNDPVNNVDESGNEYTDEQKLAIAGLVLTALLVLPFYAASKTFSGRIILASAALFMILWYGGGMSNTPGFSDNAWNSFCAGNFVFGYATTFTGVATGILNQLGLVKAPAIAGFAGVASEVFGAVEAYSVFIGLFMALENFYDAF